MEELIRASLKVDKRAGLQDIITSRSKLLEVDYLVRYIDIGVNLTSSDFADDIESVLTRAREASINTVIITGTTLADSERAIALSREHPMCLATAGVHPHHASAYSADTAARIKSLVGDDRVVAVGECGLDFYRNFSSRQDQLSAFEDQLGIAVDTRKPVFLHQRDAHTEFLAMMKEFMPSLSRAVAHCFTGTPAQAEAYLNLGMHIGITGWVTDPRRGNDLREALQVIPPERMMFETDAPYLLPRHIKMTPEKKRRNEPCYLPLVSEYVSDYLSMDNEELARQVYNTTESFFSIG